MAAPCPAALPHFHNAATRTTRLETLHNRHCAKFGTVSPTASSGRPCTQARRPSPARIADCAGVFNGHWRSPMRSESALQLTTEGRRPQVSAIIPCLNEEEAIGPVVRSVLSNSNQVTEVVVVDGNSADRTVERAAEAGARVIV